MPSALTGITTSQAIISVVHLFTLVESSSFASNGNNRSRASSWCVQVLPSTVAPATLPFLRSKPRPNSLFPIKDHPADLDAGGPMRRACHLSSVRVDLLSCAARVLRVK